MNCPNDRYVNDVGDLPGGGGEPRAHRRQDQPAGRDQGQLLPEDPASRHELLPARLDARARSTRTTCSSSIMATPNDKGQGTFNLGAYSNPKLDELTLKIQSETDQKKRNDMIREAFKIHAGRRRPHPAAPAGAGLGAQRQGEPGPAAEQLHVLQVDHAEVEAAVARRAARRAAGDSPRPAGSGGAASARREPLGALPRRRLLAFLPRLADGDRRGRGRAGLHLLRGLRRRRRAAQPDRPGDARAQRLDAAAGVDGGRHGQVPARHRRAGPRRPLRADVRRADLALRRRRLGAAVDADRRQPRPGLGLRRRPARRADHARSAT